MVSLRRKRKGAIAWEKAEDYNAAVDSVYDRARFCEAPRHRGQFIAADYVFALRFPKQADDEFPLVQAMCNDCMEIIANDLGMTAADGAVSGIHASPE